MPYIYGLSAPTFDLLGCGLVRCDARQALENDQGVRRATRTPTLDGKAAVYDAGYAVADQELVLAADLDQSALFRHLVTLYPEIHVTTAHGAFRAVPVRWWVSTSRAHLRLLLLEKISA